MHWTRAGRWRIEVASVGVEPGESVRPRSTVAKDHEGRGRGIPGERVQCFPVTVQGIRNVIEQWNSPSLSMSPAIKTRQSGIHAAVCPAAYPSCTTSYSSRPDHDRVDPAIARLVVAAEAQRGTSPKRGCQSRWS